MNPKITPAHLGRKAVIYIRQSSMDQVRNNLESQCLQYALRDKAREMGWQEIEIIDEDLGRSGTSSQNRTGFLRLVAEVSMKEVGAVFSIEASRLARNNRDWSQLVDICSLVGTLIVDHDGVYDPRILNDRLLLGLKGTMSEFELGLFRQRSQEALKAMAERGELLTTLPSGFVRTSDNRLEKDPDLRVQQAIQLVFQKFVETGSARQTLLWFRQERIAVPVVVYAEKIWRLPTYTGILHFLQNPIYAGVYAYRRTQTKITSENGLAVKHRVRRTPREEWLVFMPNHHEGYISLETYEKNQKILMENNAMKGALTRGPVRKGKSLVAGLLRCRRCGRKLQVTYSGSASNRNVPRYSCPGVRTSLGVGSCIAFGGLAVDRAIEKEVLRAISPEAIQAAMARQEDLRAGETEHRRALELAVSQAEYEAERAFRQFNACEPENRLVAAELERRWNAALTDLGHRQQELKSLQALQAKPDDLEYLLSVAEDFPALWQESGTSMEIKKRIVRTLIEEITADVNEEQSLIDLIIHWSGGCHTALSVRKNRIGQHRFTTDRDVVELVRDLANVAPDGDITNILNRLQLRTGKGNTWTADRVKTLRNYHGIPVYAEDKEAANGWLTMKKAAAFLGICPMSVSRLLARGVIKGRQVVAYAPWLIKRDDLETEQVRQAVAAIKAGRKSPPPAHPDQLELNLHASSGGREANKTAGSYRRNHNSGQPVD